MDLIRVQRNASRSFYEGCGRSMDFDVVREQRHSNSCVNALYDHRRLVTPAYHEFTKCIWYEPSIRERMRSRYGGGLHGSPLKRLLFYGLQIQGNVSIARHDPAQVAFFKRKATNEPAAPQRQNRNILKLRTGLCRAVHARSHNHGLHRDFSVSTSTVIVLSHLSGNTFLYVQHSTRQRITNSRF
ncbi:hypothetical protein JXVLWARM_CDS_0027 [Burkholderia phage Bm1]